MRAVRAADGKVEVVDVPAPTGDGVRVRIRSAGICGSDLHMLAGGFPLPHTLGHEFAGTTDDGSEVAVEPLLPCGSCAHCEEGDYNLCVRGPAIVIGAAHDGGMAEEIRVPERCIVPLPGGVTARDACLVEPLAVAVHGTRKVGLRSGQRTAVVGGGSIGLCAVAAARACGADVALAARHEHQRAAGDRLGATLAPEPEGAFPVVFEAAGTKSALEQAVALARPGGCVVLLATYWEALEPPGFAVTMKEISLVPASMYGRTPAGRDVDRAAAILAREPELPRTLVTHHFPLEAAPEAFATAADRQSGAIKVVLEP